MSFFGITSRSYQLIATVWPKFSEVEEVIIFGSRAKGNYKQGSDIDLAIKGLGCTNKLAFQIKSHLNEALPLPYFFDVVCYNDMENDELKQHIDRVGKLFYVATEAQTVNDPKTAYKQKS